MESGGMDESGSGWDNRLAFVNTLLTWGGGGGISWFGEEQLDFQEGFCSMELAGYTVTQMEHSRWGGGGEGGASRYIIDSLNQEKDGICRSI